MLDFQTLVFYGFAVVALGAACGVVFSRNPVHSALFLALTFVAAAGVWLLLHAEFLALVLVLVYVGAVMTLFLFVLMMLDINIDRLREGFWRQFPIALVFSGGLAALLAAVLSDSQFAGAARFAGGAAAGGGDNARALGAVLYTDYAYPFELAAVILLTAIVAAVALTLRRRKNVKYIDPALQARADAKSRVRLVSIPPADSAGPLSPSRQEKT